MNDVIYLNKDKQMVTALHPEFGNRDLLYAKLKRAERVYAETGVTIIGFGSRISDFGFFSFNMSVRADASIAIPRDFVKFALYGTPDTLNTNRYNLKNLSVNANAYIDINGGYSHKINDKWKVGGRVHVLVGAANAKLNFSSLDLYASEDEWRLAGQGKARLSVPSLAIRTTEDGNIDSLYMSTTDVSDILRNYEPSVGAAFDLGFEYKPVESLSLSFAIRDLGFIAWRNAHMATGNIDYPFSGLEYHYGQDNFQEYGDSIAEVFKKSYTVEGSNPETDRLYDKSVYFTMMTAKMYAAAEYSFLRNMMSLGLISKTELSGGRLYEELTAAYNLRPCRWFGMSASYSFFSGGFSSMGLGLNLRLTPFSLYLVGDYMPLCYNEQGIPYKARAFNIQTGIVMTIGCKNKAQEQFYQPTVF